MWYNAIIYLIRVYNVVVYVSERCMRSLFPSAYRVDGIMTSASIPVSLSRPARLCLCVCLYTCMYVGPYVRPAVSLLRLSARSYDWVSVCLPVRPSVSLHVRLCVVFYESMCRLSRRWSIADGATRIKFILSYGILATAPNILHCYLSHGIETLTLNAEFHKYHVLGGIASLKWRFCWKIDKYYVCKERDT